MSDSAASDPDGPEAFEGTLMDGLENEPPYPSAATTESRECVYMVKRTLVERCFYDPDTIRREFGEPDEGESWEDFVVRVFERFDGSIYGDEFFPGDASPEVYTELEERWDDE